MFCLPKTAWPSPTSGKIMFEMEGVEPKVAAEAMRLAAQKLPIPCKMVERTGQ